MEFAFSAICHPDLDHAGPPVPAESSQPQPPNWTLDLISFPNVLDALLNVRSIPI